MKPVLQSHQPPLKASNKTQLRPAHVRFPKMSKHVSVQVYGHTRSSGYRPMVGENCFANHESSTMTPLASAPGHWYLPICFPLPEASVSTQIQAQELHPPSGGSETSLRVSGEGFVGSLRNGQPAMHENRTSLCAYCNSRVRFTQVAIPSVKLLDRNAIAAPAKTSLG